ncbi:MAG: L-seryl-tRNA(Sec) selenium transferase [Polyangiaceae bacterium]
MSLRKLPKVDHLALDSSLADARERLGTKVVTALVREAIAGARLRALEGAEVAGREELLAELRQRVHQRLGQEVRAVINATGVLLHTNLGRAPLPIASLQRIQEVAGSYSTLEIDDELGVRTRRGLGAEARLAALCETEDALLVNNNAAAVLLCLSTLAAGRRVIVSRGELVEIGGGFRIPEVLARSGAELVEVGTTNRTRVQDYERAVDDRTAAMLRVHPSNFHITGFAERPALQELAQLAHARGLPLIKDLGGGLLVDLPEFIPARDREREPSVGACVAAGADLVCFSLDKLFGGPQGGAIVGARRWLTTLREDPLARALRVDKVTLAALEPLLGAYERGALDEIPVQAMLRASEETLRMRVQGWVDALAEQAAATKIVPTRAAIGGGTLAEALLPSVALAVDGERTEVVAQGLRQANVPIFARIEEGRVLLDARTVLPAQDAVLAAQLKQVLAAQ